MLNNWQRDPNYGNLELNHTHTYCKDYGCTVCAIGNCIGATPNIVITRLMAVNGFSGNLVIWDAIAKAFPGITVRRVWSYNNDDVLKNVPNVIVEVPAKAIGGSGKHWVQFIGNHNCNDPWTGKTRPVNDFLQYGDPTGYAVITGKFVDPSTPPSDDVLENNIRAILNGPGDPRTHISKIRDVLK